MFVKLQRVVANILKKLKKIILKKKLSIIHR
jgi:hypothetical protein